MKSKTNIYLIGYRCCGKTSVGALLSEKTGKPFLDTDEEIVKKKGLSILEIVSEYGWEHFRELEKNVIKDISSRKNSIIACGGGIILDENNIDFMKKSGKVFWLKASIKEIWRRMASDIKSKDFRPRLSNKPRFEEISETLFKRLPFYAEAADFAINTDNKKIEAVCSEILDLICGLDFAI